MTDQSTKSSSQLHWLYRPENRPKLWRGLWLVLALSLLPELFMHHHGNLESQGVTLDSSPGFYGWYGLIACALMVIVAKGLGFLLKRKDSYYHD
ncbi:hypothetical protein [Ferrimonas pelagia]|uniref:Uncharacterized protein n=1 Tax=Ferrimonas pelagia TaxID=1177826 RepID=A0ABP9FHJ5_9GAMM